MTTTPVAGTTQDLASAVASAAAAVLPSATPLTASLPQPGTEHVTGAFAGAAVADLEGPVAGTIAVLVAADLVAALAGSPMGDLDLAAAVQPAVDAAAAQLGSQARAGRTVDLAAVVAEVGEPFTVVPLMGDGFAAAVLVADATLEAAVSPTDGSPAEFAPDVTMAPPAAPVEPAPPVPPVAVAPAPTRGIELLHGVAMEVTVELGRTQMTVRDLLALSTGTVLELDRAAGSPADLLVNGRLIARGEVVVVDEDFGLRVTEIVDDQAAV